MFSKSGNYKTFFISAIIAVISFFHASSSIAAQIELFFPKVGVTDTLLGAQVKKWTISYFDVSSPRGAKPLGTFILLKDATGSVKKTVENLPEDARLRLVVTMTDSENRNYRAKEHEFNIQNGKKYRIAMYASGFVPEKFLGSMVINWKISELF